VISYSTVQSPGGSNVGYLRFDEFTENATVELEKAFTFFQAQNINKLVVDIRYNPGGSVNTASIFLDKMGGRLNGKVQFSMVWNPQSSGQNETLHFDTDSNSMSPLKLVFLTTGNSASASELSINAMKPYLGDNVAIVGETTHGKPTGMAGRTNGSYIYFLINFVVENSIGFYDYFDGLPPDCAVSDTDYTHALGDPDEALLQEALYYVDNGHC
jgi:C-terminal processing protease CtpA/Prc